MSKLSLGEVLETIQSHKPVEKYKKGTNHRRPDPDPLLWTMTMAESHSAAVCKDAKRKAIQRERDGLSMNSYSTSLCLQTHLTGIVWCSNFLLFDEFGTKNLVSVCQIAKDYQCILWN